MDFFIYGLLIYFILSGGFTTVNCVKSKSGIIPRDVKKIVGGIQFISGQLLVFVINQIFLERNTMFWIAAIAALIIIVCGCINLFLYMFSVK